MAGLAGFGSAAAADKVVTVQAGFIPVTDVAALYLGEEVGIFKKHGIDLKVNMGTTGAALVPSVMSGEYHFAFSSLVSLLHANVDQRQRDCRLWSGAGRQCPGRISRA
jgi:NitT/TauT family transport system substrate-binding protein